MSEIPRRRFWDKAHVTAEDFQAGRWRRDPGVESQVGRLRAEIEVAQHFMELDDG